MRHQVRWMIPLVMGLSALAGCEREPIDRVCPALHAGDLAISEIRGPQGGGTDTWGQWIEIHNPTDAELSLCGLLIRVQRLDGSGATDISVRDRGASIDPLGYFVFGRFPADDLPAHVDYGYEADFSGDLYSNGVIDLYGCDEVPVDRITYEDLTTEGSLSYDGALVLTAESNDEQADWCVDDHPAEPGDGGTTALGLPGTPKEMNLSCPE
ncbi:MAG: lamin tail domain-containing protein [Deltaproteobacteria bacterium]|nr:lamin tail domain-containing protein [Deltaproteobacteria bacterium]